MSAPILRASRRDGREALKIGADIGVRGSNGAHSGAHPIEMPFLEIRRQTGISRTWIAALQRLPGKVVGLDRMFFDQPSEPIEQNLAQRGLALGEQGALARRDTQAEQ